MIGSRKDRVLPLPVYDKHNKSLFDNDGVNVWDCTLVGFEYPS